MFKKQDYYRGKYNISEIMRNAHLSAKAWFGSVVNGGKKYCEYLSEAIKESWERCRLSIKESLGEINPYSVTYREMLLKDSSKAVQFYRNNMKQFVKFATETKKDAFTVPLVEIVNHFKNSNNQLQLI